MGKRPSVFTPKITFDGYANQLNWGGASGALAGYSHIFRNGAIESVNAELLTKTFPDNAGLPLYWLEILAMNSAERMLKTAELLKIPGPYYLLVALLNV